jgi:hypothetical protein
MTFQNPMVNPSEKYVFSNGLQWLIVVNGWLMDGYYNIIYLVGGFNLPL